MVAAKIEMVNLRMESTPSNEHPARLMVTFAEALIGEVRERGVSALTQIWPRPFQLQAARPGGQPCNNG